MEKIFNSIKVDTYHVGKYFNTHLTYCGREKEWFDRICYCTAAYNENGTLFLIMKLQCGTEYKVTEHHIVNEVIANPNPKYKIGQNVLATVNYHMNEAIDNYCRIERVITFCNTVSYEILIINSNKKIIVQEDSIKKLAELKTPKFHLGLQVGVKIYPTSGYTRNDEYTIKNGAITKINQWFDSVTYDVTLDDNTVQTNVYEGYITQPYTPPPPVDMKQFLKTREQQLLEELEMVRKMMC
jgi:hypothetical protein